MQAGFLYFGAEGRDSEVSAQLPSRFVAEIDQAFVEKKEYIPAGTAKDHIEAIRRLLNPVQG